jgi:hypothetical protein
LSWLRLIWSWSHQWQQRHRTTNTWWLIRNCAIGGLSYQEGYLRVVLRENWASLCTSGLPLIAAWIRDSRLMNDSRCSQILIFLYKIIIYALTASWPLLRVPSRSLQGALLEAVRIFRLTWMNFGAIFCVASSLSVFTGQKLEESGKTIETFWSTAVNPHFRSFTHPRFRRQRPMPGALSFCNEKPVQWECILEGIRSGRGSESRHFNSPMCCFSNPRRQNGRRRRTFHFSPFLTTWISEKGENKGGNWMDGDLKDFFFPAIYCFYT